MNRKIFFLSFVLPAVVAGFFLLAPAANAAFGISPPFLNADHLVAGTTYVQTVYLVQDQPNVDLPIKATLSVPDSIQSWITLNTGFNFVIPAGTHQFPVQITVQVPTGQGIGKFSGNLSFTSQPSQSGQVTIALGANVAINLTVGTGIFEQFSVPSITFPDIEEGWNPRADVKFENDGNVPEAFDAATFEIFDQYDNIRLDYIQKSDGFPSTPAFTTDEYTIEFPTDFHLGVGSYWGNVVFYQNGKAIASQKTVFHVLPAGAILGTFGSALYALEHGTGWLLYVIIALLLVIIILIVLFYRRRSSQKGRQA